MWEATRAVGSGAAGSEPHAQQRKTKVGFSVQYIRGLSSGAVQGPAGTARKEDRHLAGVLDARAEAEWQRAAWRNCSRHEENRGWTPPPGQTAVATCCTPCQRRTVSAAPQIVSVLPAHPRISQRPLQLAWDRVPLLDCPHRRVLWPSVRYIRPRLPAPPPLPSGTTAPHPGHPNEHPLREAPAPPLPSATQRWAASGCAPRLRSGEDEIDRLRAQVHQMRRNARALPDPGSRPRSAPAPPSHPAPRHCVSVLVESEGEDSQVTLRK